jgi:hypothetical protein
LFLEPRFPPSHPSGKQARQIGTEAFQRLINVQTVERFGYSGGQVDQRQVEE